MAVDDHHFRPEDPSELETELASLNMEPSKAHRKRTTSGSRAKYVFTCNVFTYHLFSLVFKLCRERPYQETDGQ